MLRRPPRSTRTDTLFPTRRSSDLATAGNASLHTYVFQQRIGILVDWFRVLRADRHGDRFRAWGVINDPDCCIPGSDGCPAKSLEENFGFEWCPGDRELLAHVGKTGYRDRSEEHTSELQYQMRISYAVFCLKTKKKHMKQQPKHP